jgi:hypothetical protein
MQHLMKETFGKKRRIKIEQKNRFAFSNNISIFFFKFHAVADMNALICMPLTPCKYIISTN